MPSITGDHPDIIKILKQLTVKPYVAEGIETVEYKVYKKEKNIYHIPRFYGNKLQDKTMDKLQVGKSIPNIIFDKDLRPYQEEVGKKILSHILEKESGICCLYTGWGKTCIALWLIAQLKVKTLIVVHKETLLVQWTERIKFFLNINAGILRQNEENIIPDVVVGTVQSIINREYNTKDFGLLIIDETHHYSTRVFSKLFYKIPVKYSLGLTATLERKDRLEKVIKWFLGEVIVDIKQLSENPKIILKEFIQDEYPDDKLNRIGKINLAGMITDLCNNQKRNDFIIKIILDLIKDNRKILLLTDRRNHCISLNTSLQKLNINSGLYLGKMTNDLLQESNEKQVILATYQMASEGYDNVKLDSLILASPKTSIEQSIGRILRQKNINPPTVIDIVDPFSIFQVLHFKRFQFYKKKGYFTPKRKDLDLSICSIVD